MPDNDFTSILMNLSGDIGDIKGSVGRLEGEVSGLRSDVTDLKSDTSDLKSDTSDLKSDVSSLKDKTSNIKTGSFSTDSLLPKSRLSKTTIIWILSAILAAMFGVAFTGYMFGQSGAEPPKPIKLDAATHAVISDIFSDAGV